MACCLRWLSTVLVLALVVVLLPLLIFAAPNYSSWSDPVNLGPVVNSSFIDQGPALTKDGLSLYFSSDRPGGSGFQDIWVTQRASLDAPWAPPVNIQIVNSEYLDFVPSLSRDEHWMFFNSSRPGGFGGYDIWVSYRTKTKDDFGWGTPVNIGPAINTSSNDQGGFYFQNDDAGIPQLFFISDRAGGMGGYDIYVSEIFPNGFGPAQPVLELNSPALDARPSIRFDGLEMVFFSARPDTLGGYDLWTATRQTVFDQWSTLTNLGPTINGTANDQTPFLAADRQTLYFASNREGSLDLFMATRTKQQP